MKRVFASCVLAVLAVACCAQIDPSRTVVVVNGEEIKGDEYYRRMEYLPDVGRVLQGANVAVYPPGFLTIAQLIDEHLILQLAKNKGVSPSDAEVDQWLKDSLAADPKLLGRWLGAGRTENELKYQFRVQVAQFKVQTQGITVTDQEVEDYYRKNPPKIPRTVTFRMIAVANEADEKAVDSDLSSGKSFEEVAKARSADITQAVGGEVGTLNTDYLPKEVKEAVDSTKVNQVTNWVDTNGVHVKYFIEAKAAEQTRPLDTVRTSLRRQLMLIRSKDTDIMRDVSDLRKKSAIDIKQREFAEMYDRFVKTYLKG